jgi:methyltransferase-like protein/SAM-dependent methyltransferase
MIPHRSNSAYDDLPYPSYPFPQTHPDHLAVLAILFGLEPTPPARARVLELGAASGGNLIPLALVYPQATFLGVDLSWRQVEEGVGTIAALGLKNVELRHASILDVDEGYGQFDYILCHGVYSWVPGEVQDKILDVCANNLAPDGVAIVSYNTLPGWHLRGMIRDMMLYHTNRLREKDPKNQIAQARALMDFLVRSCQNENTAYSLLLKEELELQQKLMDPHLYHDRLGRHNEPIYFHQFHERLAGRKLRYLGESIFRDMYQGNLPVNVQEVLRRLAPDQIELEQYLDFLRNRTFRNTLLCHEHQRPSYNVSPDRLAGLQMASPLQPPSAGIDLRSPAAEEFRSAQDDWIRTHEPLMKAAMVCLGERWPRTVPFEELCRLARQRLDGSAPTDPAAVARDRHELGKTLLNFYAGGSDVWLRLWRQQPEFADRLSERPVASPLARLQAARGVRVSNLLHETITLTELLRQVLPYLDGTHTLPDLRERMAEHYRKGLLVFSPDGAPIREESQARAVLAQRLDQELPWLAQGALLVA